MEMTMEKLAELIGEQAKKAVADAMAKTTEANGEKLFAPAISKSAAKREAKSLVGAYCIAKARGRAEGVPAHEIAKGVYGETAPVTKALLAGTTNSGAELVSEQLSTEFIELLRNASVLRAAGVRQMDNPTGNMTIAKHTASDEAVWVGEGVAPADADETFDVVTFTWKTLTKEVPISKDLIMFASFDAEEIVARSITQSIGEKEDATFLRATASATVPGGILTLTPAPQKFDANGTVNAANVERDVALLVERLMVANVPVNERNGLFIMNSRTSTFLATLRDANGALIYPQMSVAPADRRMLGFRVAVTNSIPRNLGGGTNQSEVYFISTDEWAIADGQNQMELNVSEHTDFSKRMVRFQGVTRTDFHPLRNVGAAVLQEVTWGA